MWNQHAPLSDGLHDHVCTLMCVKYLGMMIITNQYSCVSTDAATVVVAIRSDSNL